MDEDLREERRAHAREHREMKRMFRYGHASDPWGYVLFVAWIGAVVYFVQQTDGAFWPVVLAFLKACVWPALVMFHLLGLLGLS